MTGPGSPNHNNPNSQYKHADQTMQERAHVGSASWVDAPSVLSEFVGGVTEPPVTYPDVIRSGGRYERRQPRDRHRLTCSNCAPFVELFVLPDRLGNTKPSKGDRCLVFTDQTIIIERFLASVSASTLAQKFIAPCDLEVVGMSLFLGTAAGSTDGVAVNVSVVPTSQVTSVPSGASNQSVTNPYNLWTTTSADHSWHGDVERRHQVHHFDGGEHSLRPELPTARCSQFGHHGLWDGAGDVHHEQCQCGVHASVDVRVPGVGSACRS